MDKFAVFGMGGHGRVVAEILIDNGAQVFFFDDDSKKENNIYADLSGNFEDLESKIKDFTGVFVGIGNNKIRLENHQRLKALGAEILVITHNSAIVSSSAKIGKGTVIMPGAIVGANVTIGESCIINSGAIVEHDCILGDGVHISPGVCVSGGVSVGECSWIGLGARVLNNVSIGPRVIVGMGSILLSDVSADDIVYGIPAKVKDQNYN